MEVGESKAILYPNPRYILSFNSIKDLQYYCQDVYYVKRIKLDLIKRRRLTRQSSLNVKAFPSVSVKLDYYCNLLKEESPYKYTNETMNSLILEPVDFIIPTGLVGLEVKSGLV